MSESVTRIDAAMPRGYEMLSAIEIKQKDDSLRFNGVIEMGEDDNKIERRVQIPDLAEIWGVPEDAPMVTIPADIRQMFSELFAELRTIAASPHESQLSEMKERMDKLEQDNISLQAENQKLEERILSLQRQLDEAKSGSSADEDAQRLEQQLSEEFGGDWVARKGDNVAIRESDGYTSDGWTTIEEPYKKDDEKWYTNVTNGEENREVWVGDLSRQREAAANSPVGQTSAVNAETIVEPAQADARYRTTEPLISRLRRRFSGEPAPPEYYFVDDAGRRYYLGENNEREYINNDRDSGVLIVGAVALAAAAGIVGYLIGHNEKEDHNAQPRVQRVYVDQNHRTRLSEKDRTLLVQDLRADQKANEQRVQQIENLKNIQRLTRQSKKVDVQIRNGIRRTNYLLEPGHSPSETEIYDSGGNYSTSTEAGNVGYQYPWNWAATKYSPTQAEKQLHILGERAAKKGHKVRWIYKGTLPNGARREILEVDGTTNTQKVLNIVARYQ